jgi:hypothetical protein
MNAYMKFELSTMSIRENKILPTTFLKACDNIFLKACDNIFLKVRLERLKLATTFFKGQPPTLKACDNIFLKVSLQRLKLATTFF